MGLQLLDGPPARQVVAMAEVDVTGAPERGEPEAQRGDAQAGASERMAIHGGQTERKEAQVYK
jgi:hypothetical protein